MAPCDVPVGVITGDDVIKLLKHAKDSGYAIPAFNFTSSSTANTAMEAAAKNNSPVMIQASNGGAQFMARKSIKDKNACAASSVALAMHVRAMAPYYGIPVIMHSDHSAKKLFPWFDGMLEADTTYFAQYGEPLFSSHMLDLLEEPDEENIAICASTSRKWSTSLIHYACVICFINSSHGDLFRTGGEEDGVNNEDINPEKLYTSPEQVFSVYEALSPIGEGFSIAAAFSNVHGVYKHGNVSLSPEKLAKHQAYVKEKLSSEEDKPIFLAMHGGSGSNDDEIKQTAVSAGVVKMNVDTDTQWSYWDGCHVFVSENHDYLQGQIGNPKGPDAPNEKFYDPHVWIHKYEESTEV